MTPDVEPVPCGAVDLAAFLLAPVHINCAGCRAAILELSRGRTPMRGSPVRQPTLPTDGPDWWGDR